MPGLPSLGEVSSSVDGFKLMTGGTSVPGSEGRTSSMAAP
jgi:hypothetical protein